MNRKTPINLNIKENFFTYFFILFSSEICSEINPNKKTKIELKKNNNDEVERLNILFKYISYANSPTPVINSKKLNGTKNFSGLNSIKVLRIKSNVFKPSLTLTVLFPFLLATLIGIYFNE
jgi:hypothetical protein